MTIKKKLSFLSNTLNEEPGTSVKKLEAYLDTCSRAETVNIIQLFSRD